MTQKTSIEGVDSKLRIAIVGLGRMGLLHLRTLQRLPGVSIAALVDVDHHKAQIASLHGIPFFANCEHLVGRVDAVIIATPVHEHVVCALPLLKAGIHCLIEKPLALNLLDLDRLGSMAEHREVTLAVGHCERFNAGVLSAKAALHQDMSRIHVIRKQPISTRHEIDIDVVQDLMVHDLDWIVDSVGELPADLKIIDAYRLNGKLETVSCSLFFSNGLEAVVEGNRVSSARQRAVVLGNNRAGRVISLDQPLSSQPDALTKQAEAFIDAVRGEHSSIATWIDARQVMELVNRIRHASAVHLANSVPMASLA